MLVSTHGEYSQMLDSRSTNGSFRHVILQYHLQDREIHSVTPSKTLTERENGKIKADFVLLMKMCIAQSRESIRLISSSHVVIKRIKGTHQGVKRSRGKTATEGCREPEHEGCNQAKAVSISSSRRVYEEPGLNQNSSFVIWLL